ncbi:MAG: AAA family ATPase [Lachnospiraceae bacterium]|nr:AAA family ATPase [Lachnospiraceae bacterium]
MTEQEKQSLRERIEKLPAGGITYKTINGKRYPYLQWTEDGRQRSRVIKAYELAMLAEAIEERKKLEYQLKENPVRVAEKKASYGLSTVSHTGEQLRRFIMPVKGMEKRECYSVLRDYLYGDDSERVFILYGLRRTGKTTLIRQAIAEMDDEMFAKTAFLQVTRSHNLAQLNRDLRILAEEGYRYIFIDEVTMMEDFIEGAALLSDIFVSSGMKIVLSGTDSLGFVFTEDEQLYDRCIMLHTTWIPYREFDRVLGIHGVDEYIRYGGTMSLGNSRYNAPTFATKESADEYVDSSIAQNIQHSLRYYQEGGHFRNLRELYERGELTGAINRIVEDINHAFTLEVLTRPFRSEDLRLSAANLRRDRKHPSDILDRVDTEAITERLRKLLSIRNKEEQTVTITDAHRTEIKEYLDLLDITCDIPIVHMTDYNIRDSRAVITQPGLRFAQVKALIEELLQDETFRSYSLTERNYAAGRIVTEVQGRMLEDIVLLETRMARSDCKVFHLQFAVGEFDMVVCSPETESCEIYEIKHSAEIAPEQTRHLRDADKCNATAFRFGTIAGKYVIYRGKSTEVDGIRYVNAEEYLLGLGKEKTAGV